MPSTVADDNKAINLLGLISERAVPSLFAAGHRNAHHVNLIIGWKLYLVPIEGSGNKRNSIALGDGTFDVIVSR